MKKQLSLLLVLALVLSLFAGLAVTAYADDEPAADAAEAALEILGAVMYRKAMTTADLGVAAPGSVSSMVLGVIMAAVGVLGLIFPVVAEFFVWVWIVCELILSGIRLIWAARTVGILGASSE